MFARFSQNFHTNHPFAFHIAAISFMASSLSACGTVVSSTSSANSQPTAAFPYSASPLANTIIPPNNSTPISDAFFGMTIHRLVPNPASPNLPVAPFPAFPIHTFRLWDVVNWSTLEPAPGQFNWSTMDGTIAVARQNNVRDFLFTLGDVPTWASTNPSDTCGWPNAPPNGACDAPDPAALHDFLAHVVQRYCGVVEFYESWNEPNLTPFWSGTDAQLLQISADLYQIAKDPANCGCTNGSCSPGGGLNPNQVLLPSINSINSTTLAWLDNYLAAAGPTYPYADIASFHGYGATQPEDIVSSVAQFRQILAKHGLSQLDLWDTEASWGQTLPNDQQSEAAWLLRFHVAQLASGVSRFIWYAYDNCAWGTLYGPACANNSSDNWRGVRQPG